MVWFRRRPRRSALRNEVHWFAGFKFADGPSDAWHVCRVVELSVTGAVLEVYADVPVRRHDYLVLDFELADHHAGLQVLARVVRRTGISAHSVLLTVEFVDVADPTSVALVQLVGSRALSGR